MAWTKIRNSGEGARLGGQRKKPWIIKFLSWEVALVVLLSSRVVGDMGSGSGEEWAGNVAWELSI